MVAGSIVSERGKKMNTEMFEQMEEGAARRRAALTARGEALRSAREAWTSAYIAAGLDPADENKSLPSADETFWQAADAADAAFTAVQGCSLC